MIDAIYYEWYAKQSWFKKLKMKINKSKKRHYFILDQIVFKSDYLMNKDKKKIEKILEVIK